MGFPVIPSQVLKPIWLQPSPKALVVLEDSLAPCPVSPE